MFTNGADYQLARRLKALEDNGCMSCQESRGLSCCAKKFEEIYTRRSRNVRFAVGIQKELHFE